MCASGLCSHFLIANLLASLNQPSVLLRYNYLPVTKTGSPQAQYTTEYINLKPAAKFLLRMTVLLTGVTCYIN